MASNENFENLITFIIARDNIYISSQRDNEIDLNIRRKYCQLSTQYENNARLSPNPRRDLTERRADFTFVGHYSYENDIFYPLNGIYLKSLGVSMETWKQ